MQARWLWIAGALALVVGVYCVFFQNTLVVSKIASEGVRTLGQVMLKDSVPEADGRMTYNVTFIFPDSSGRNHQVTRAVFDKGVWDSLRANQEVKVYYLASDPEQAAIQGTEGLAVPHGAALRFVGWTLILAAAGCGVAAFRRANNTADPNSGTGQPKRKVVHAGKR